MEKNIINNIDDRSIISKTDKSIVNIKINKINKQEIKNEIKNEMKNEIKNETKQVLDKVTNELTEEVVKRRRVTTVMFEVTKKRYYFEVDDSIECKHGEKVIVETVRGKEIGVICGRTVKVAEENLILPLKPILHKATEKELETYEFLKKEAKEAYKIFNERISFYDMKMKLIECEYTLDKSKLIFYFIAETRIDFRELVKNLANIFKTRIELRQIGVRDEARILGTIGICGKELCCRVLLNKFDSVSIKMARDQGLVINPTKISGVCGRLLCCINYEYYQYEEALKNFPEVNQFVKTKEGKGKVISIVPLNGFLYIDVEGHGIQKYNIEDITFNKNDIPKIKRVNVNLKSPDELALELEE